MKGERRNGIWFEARFRICQGDTIAGCVVCPSSLRVVRNEDRQATQGRRDQRKNAVRPLRLYADWEREARPDVCRMYREDQGMKGERRE
jgi:hypothetical protein